VLHSNGLDEDVCHVVEVKGCVPLGIARALGSN
jgi:hypothetical protein